MTDNNFREQVDPSNSSTVTNNMLENKDYFADQVPVAEPLIHETPMGGTIAAVGPMTTGPGVAYEPVISETPPTLTTMPETVVEELPLSTTLPYAAVSVSEPILTRDPVELKGGSLAALISPEESDHFRTRWNEIQGKFVDEPRAAVQQADTLVSEVIGQITEMFTHEHGVLESKWNQGNDVSTEDLRTALQRYRSFFNRLVLPRVE